MSEKKQSVWSTMEGEHDQPAQYVTGYVPEFANIYLMSGDHDQYQVTIWKEEEGSERPFAGQYVGYLSGIRNKQSSIDLGHTYNWRRDEQQGIGTGDRFNWFLVAGPNSWPWQDENHVLAVASAMLDKPQKPSNGRVWSLEPLSVREHTLIYKGFPGANQAHVIFPLHAGWLGQEVKALSDVMGIPLAILRMSYEDEYGQGDLWSVFMPVRLSLFALTIPILFHWQSYHKLSGAVTDACHTLELQRRIDKILAEKEEEKQS